jgi:SAM-dependent methyltransferase
MGLNQSSEEPPKTLPIRCANQSSEVLKTLSIRCAHCNAVFTPEKLDYGAVTSRFTLELLRDAFVRLGRDAETNEFLLRSHRRGEAENRALSEKCTVLRASGMSLTDANATLGRSAMHVFSLRQADALLELCGEDLGKMWFLDVGAGTGEVTESLARHFRKTCATESSRGMARRLRKRGFSVVLQSDSIDTVVEDVRGLPGGEDLAADGFDVVAALNLCDRVSTPVTLMAQLKRALKPGTGILILAIVVPFRPFVEGEDGARIKPAEVVLNTPSTGTWEAGVEALWENLIRPAGFDLVALSRVPYISEGDHNFGAYTLDDAVFVLRPSRLKS